MYTSITDLAIIWEKRFLAHRIWISVILPLDRKIIGFMRALEQNVNKGL